MKSIKAVWNAIPHKFLLLGPQVIFWFGAFLNQLVMVFNGSVMPVQVPGGCPVDSGELLDFVHSCMTSGTHLKFLADIINVHDGIASVGDLFLWTGDLLTIPALILVFGLVIGERIYNERVLPKS